MPRVAEDAIRDATERELARASLLDFAKRVYPGFQTPAHIRLIANLLERCERREVRRLAVCVPVRHGKSVLCSQVFSPWYIGRNPADNIILASHAESLATTHSRIAKHLVEDDRWPFEGVRLSPDSQSVQRWNVTGGGGLYAVGVGGGITGRGANVLLVDDALHDGLSATEREAAWKWFTEVAVPRLEPGGIIIVVGARFASDDLVGRIEDSEDASEWEIVRLPALAEDGDPLGRAADEPLWPERMPFAELQSRRTAMGSYAFSAQFQQSPVPSGGVMFSPAMLEPRFDSIPAHCFEPKPLPFESDPLADALRAYSPNALRRPLLRAQALDCAAKTGLQNDQTAIATVSHDLRDFFVEDVWLGRVDFPNLCRVARDQYERHRPSHVFIESASSGIQLLDVLQQSTGLPVVPVKATDGKGVRAQAVLGLFEAQRVRFPASGVFPSGVRVADVVNTFLRFGPDGCKLDDAVDAIVWALLQLREIAQRVTGEDALYDSLGGPGSWMLR